MLLEELACLPPFDLTHMGSRQKKKKKPSRFHVWVYPYQNIGFHLEVYSG